MDEIEFVDAQWGMNIEGLLKENEQLRATIEELEGKLGELQKGKIAEYKQISKNNEVILERLDVIDKKAVAALAYKIKLENELKQAQGKVDILKGLVKLATDELKEKKERAEEKSNYIYALNESHDLAIDNFKMRIAELEGVLKYVQIFIHRFGPMMNRWEGYRQLKEKVGNALQGDK